MLLPYSPMVTEGKKKNRCFQTSAPILGRDFTPFSPNFTSIPFDYPLISWVTNYVSNRGFLTCLSWIVSINRELHSQTFRAKIWLTFSEFFDNIPLRIFLDVLFRVFRFSKASFYALTYSFMTF